MTPADATIGVNDEHRSHASHSVLLGHRTAVETYDRKVERAVFEQRRLPRSLTSDAQQSSAGRSRQIRDEPIVCPNRLGPRRVPVRPVKGEQHGRATQFG